MRMLDLRQGSDLWHEWRAGGIGGSDCASIMNCSPYTSYRDLLYYKQGKKVLPEFSEYLAKRGHKAERVARDHVAGILGETLLPLCYQHDELSYVRASLDGITDDETTCFEAKLVGVEKFNEARETKKPPQHHYWQMQYGMFASGAQTCIYAVVNNDYDVFFFNVDRCDEDIARLIDQVSKFWELIKSGDDVDGEAGDPIDMDGDNEFVALMGDYIGLTEQIESLQKNQQSIRKQIIERAGNQKLVCRFGQVTSFEKKGSVSYSKYVKDQGLSIPDSYRGKPTRVHKIAKASE